MKKLEWQKEVAHKAGLSKLVVEKVISSFEEVLYQALKNEGGLSWAGVANFKVKHVAARKGRNPKTGKELNIPARNKVFVKVGKHLSDAVK